MCKVFVIGSFSVENLILCFGVWVVVYLGLRLKTLNFYVKDKYNNCGLDKDIGLPDMVSLRSHHTHKQTPTWVW